MAACGVGLKFSPTLLVGRELHHFIRWSVVLLGVLVRTEGSLPRTPPPPPPPLLARLVTSRHAASRRGLPVVGISPSRSYLCITQEKCGRQRKRFALMASMENECELKHFVLSALKYGRFQSLNSPLNCVRFRWPSACVCAYIREVAPL